MLQLVITYDGARLQRVTQVGEKVSEHRLWTLDAISGELDINPDYALSDIERNLIDALREWNEFSSPYRVFLDSRTTEAAMRVLGLLGAGYDRSLIVTFRSIYDHGDGWVAPPIVEL